MLFQMTYIFLFVQRLLPSGNIEVNARNLYFVLVNKSKEHVLNAYSAVMML